MSETSPTRPSLWFVVVAVLVAAAVWATVALAAGGGAFRIERHEPDAVVAKAHATGRRRTAGGGCAVGRSPTCW